MNTKSEVTKIVYPIGLLVGISFIVFARESIEHLPLGPRWAMNAAGWVILAVVLYPVLHKFSEKGVAMNKLLGVLAVLGVAIIYGVVINYMGWRSGGGLIPSLIFFFAARAVWLGVTKSGPSKPEEVKADQAVDAKDHVPPPPPTPAPQPFAGFQDIPQPPARPAPTKFLNSGKE